MRIPLSWLKEYVEISIPLDELAKKMTLAGLEVASITQIGEIWDRDKMFVGEVIRVEPHPDADRLTLPTVRYGDNQTITVVTGAPNIRVGQSGMKVALALAGAQLIDGHSETRRMAILKPTKIRGIASAGMVCSELELGLSEEHEGILILPEDAPLGTPLVDYLGDAVLDLDLTPNLARCLSVIGVAREVAALTDQKYHLQEPHMEAAGAPSEGQIELEIVDPELCARYTAALIKGVTIGPSPWWMQRRLTLAGMRPINNIVDITNYVMLEWGQPLHAFDYQRLRPRLGSDHPPAVIVRRARLGERMTTLDNVERVLTEDMLLITDGQGPVAIAGVMGGLESEVTSETRDVLLESANFDFINNRQTSQALKLSSEASNRFGRGIPASRTSQAARRAAQLMRELAGGEIALGLADAYPRPQESISVSFTVPDVERVLGFPMGRMEIVNILTRLDFDCQLCGDAGIRATVPDHRLDVRIPADIMEELARVYGYDRIPISLMRDELPPQRHNAALEEEERIRDILIGCGLQEIITYSLTSLSFEQRIDPTGEALNLNNYVRLANPLSSERETMRRSLAASMLDTLAANLRHTDQVQMFEIGAVYLPVAGQQLPQEPARLAIAVSGSRDRPSWHKGSRGTFDFFALKGIIEVLLLHLRVEGASFSPYSAKPFQAGRAASLEAAGQILGQFGEVHPLVRESSDLPAQTVCLAELDLDILLSLARPQTIVKPIPRYPAVAQDLAVVVDEDTPAGHVHDVIMKAGGLLLARAALFDVYRGDQIPAGKKSLAFALLFQAPDRTLTDNEVRRFQERIVKALVKQLDVSIRE